MSAKTIVKSFYESDLANDASLIPEFFHKDCELHWNSSQGFSILNYEDIKTFFDGIIASYLSLRFKMSHVLEDGNFVSTRHTLFAKTIEDPENEQALAHFMSIWEVKDEKLYRCYEISQLTNENALASGSFSEIKV